MSALQSRNLAPWGVVDVFPEVNGLFPYDASIPLGLRISMFPFAASSGYEIVMTISLPISGASTVMAKTMMAGSKSGSTKIP